MERAVIISIVFLSAALLAWRLLRIFKESDSPCCGCGKDKCCGSRQEGNHPLPSECVPGDCAEK
ncbi:MAG: hypothetical protein PHV40_02165 [Candidatus Omnitrophica bacterium]|nr:hypothetical protein [Candidatus Omnitrophota bacterium]